MRLLIVLAFFFALSMPADAVILTVKECASDRIVVTNQGAATDCASFPDRCGTVLFSDLRRGSDELKRADLEGRLNAYAVNRQPLTSLDLEEPTRVSNPGATFGERFYWCTADSEPLAFGESADVDTQLCSRADVITVTALPDGVACSITVRTSRNCAQNPDFIACPP